MSCTLFVLTDLTSCARTAESATVRTPTHFLVAVTNAHPMSLNSDDPKDSLLSITLLLAPRCRIADRDLWQPNAPD
jgi:hypothetical protein